jgi:hypothetical protein
VRFVPSLLMLKVPNKNSAQESTIVTEVRVPIFSLSGQMPIHGVVTGYDHLSNLTLQ